MRRERTDIDEDDDEDEDEDEDDDDFEFNCKLCEESIVGFGLMIVSIRERCAPGEED